MYMLLKNTFIYADAREILNILPQLEEGKNDLSRPTGKFFYDPWELLPQYKEGTCYSEHADIDDRYHLTLDAESSYLIDMDTDFMNATTVNNTVSLMDGGILHSAANFGHLPRAELVVRKLLKHNKLKDPASLNLTVRYDIFDLRYRFDIVFSPWLNRANKKGIIDNFEPVSETEMNLHLEKEYIDEFKELIEFSELPMELKID